MKFRLPRLLAIFLLLTGCYVFSNTAQSYKAPNVWDVLRDQLMLNHEVTQPEVQTQLRWLISHPSYLHKLAQSEPYIYHIVTEIKKRHMPGEIALLPMIESAYDPFAYSGAGAAGLWQLMPGTGNDLGLKRDWWFDGRRSIRPSTDAALSYLTYLNKFFDGNWILAIAAYDSGEGTIAHAIKNSGQASQRISFWSLPVPRETRAYVPRLLALAEIIKYPQRYKVTLPNIPHTPYFEEVNIGSQIDLNHAAKLAGITYKDLIKLNPGYNRWATAPYRPFKLLIPANKVANFNHNLAGVPEEKRVSWTRHQVRFGDTLNTIARKYFTTAKLIQELNQLKSNKLKIGQYIMIPSSKNTAVASKDQSTTSVSEAVTRTLHSKDYKVIHIVQAKDTYQSLKNKYNITVEEIQQWNHLAHSAPLKPGMQLVLWKRPQTSVVYTVKTGDSLSTIAKRNHIKTSMLVKLNPSINKRLIRPGQKIIVG